MTGGVDTGTAETAADEEPPDEATGGRRWSLRSLANLESLVYLFGSWTIGYWVALALGRGWAVALPLSLLVIIGVVALGWWPQAPRQRSVPDAPELGAVGLVLALVLVWPAALELGRGPLAVVAVVLIAARLLLVAVNSRGGSFELRGPVIAGVAVMAALVVVVSWTLFVVLVLAVAASLLVRPDWLERLDSSERGTSAEPRRSWWSAPAANVALLVFGGLIAVWQLGSVFWSEDNAYYFNKAMHYGDAPLSFPVQDYMYGVDDLLHIPFGNILSSYEPLIGLFSQLSTVSVPVWIFSIAGPGVVVLLPFAARYAAHGLGVGRPTLVGALAAGSVLLMTGSETANLFPVFSYGKTLGRLVLIAVLLGAMGHLVQRPTARAAATATFAGVAAVGMSPSLGIAALVLVAPLTMGGVLGVWQRRRELGQRLRPMLGQMLTPLLVLGAYGLFAAAFQAQSGQVRGANYASYSTPASAWEARAAIPLEPQTLLGLVFVVGSAATWPLVLGSSRLRRSAALVSVLVFGLLFAPWSFDLIVDDILDLNYFARRILWALPLVAVFGLVAANLDRKRWWALLTVAALTIGLGLSGATPTGILQTGVVDVSAAPIRLPWESGIPQRLRSAAVEIVDATPPGGRFLAPQFVEGTTTATTASRYPVYARGQYIDTMSAASSTPASFEADERRLLEAGINGRRPAPPVERWIDALEQVDVSTVCLGPDAVEGLRRAVRVEFENRGNLGPCSLWTRPAS